MKSSSSFFIIDERLIKTKAIVEYVLNSDKMTKEESIALIEKHQTELLLNSQQMKRWGGKIYLVHSH